jgi:hypothetical protein
MLLHVEKVARNFKEIDIKYGNSHSTQRNNYLDARKLVSNDITALSPSHVDLLVCE